MGDGRAEGGCGRCVAPPSAHVATWTCDYAWPWSLPGPVRLCSGACQVYVSAGASSHPRLAVSNPLYPALRLGGAALSASRGESIVSKVDPLESGSRLQGHPRLTRHLVIFYALRPFLNLFFWQLCLIGRGTA